MTENKQEKKDISEMTDDEKTTEALVKIKEILDTYDLEIVARVNPQPMLIPKQEGKVEEKEDEGTEDK